jgi:hypothetical protein
MLAGDSRAAWDSHVLDDPRVLSFWDGNRISGSWFGGHAVGELGGGGYVVWDAYFAFPKLSRWQAIPSGVVAAGSDIIDHTAALEDRFIPLLRECLFKAGAINPTRIGRLQHVVSSLPGARTCRWPERVGRRSRSRSTAGSTQCSTLPSARAWLRAPPSSSPASGRGRLRRPS